jgi:hypothetical protein
MKWKVVTLFGALLFMSLVATAQQKEDKVTPESTEQWEPEPVVITPGAKPGDAPSDAVILFDGKNLDQWESTVDGKAPQWVLKDGAMTVAAGTKDIKTKKVFGDFQLHVEWRTPQEVDPAKTGQGRGNSGIFLQGLYEVQVLDNYNNKTYVNGQASAIYKQHVPLVNASRKPGEWQVYDIFYTAPRFSSSGRITFPAYVTVIHNGIITQNHVSINGPTNHKGLKVYQAHEKGPIVLQEHGNPVSYRNIWIREM